MGIISCGMTHLADLCIPTTSHQGMGMSGEDLGSSDLSQGSGTSAEAEEQEAFTAFILEPPAQPYQTKRGRGKISGRDF